MPRSSLSLREARRITLAAQGFGRPRPAGRISTSHIRRVVQDLGLLQLDFVNVLVPAHYLVVYSRLGAYDKASFNQLIYNTREFTEQWAHEASIVPASLWPTLEYRRRDFRPYANSPIMKLKGKSKYLSQALDLIVDKGAVTSRDLPPVAGPKRKAGDWHRSVPRWALEYHFGLGKLAVVNRLANFQRVYDLAERVIHPDHLERSLSRHESHRELLTIAANAFGVATAHDLADYYRMSVREAQPRLDELVTDGTIRPVQVEGWKEQAYLAPESRLPRQISCSSLLSPFDPLVWYRPRAERLFDFHYRIEIYVTAAKRKWGYYVLPFLLDDEIVGRVDLKADRQKGCLLVLASHAEENIDEARVVDCLGDELMSLARWLGLERMKVSRRGPFARRLAASVKGKGYS
ncbi:MAG: hypothetical protein ACI88G_000167 [Woeseiaceae bacterium]|jgi:uncharacterized protein YcaQ